ncbi:serine-threonine protein kinase [Streptomyces sp. NPDC097619]|uniref:serine-threonine protein kinase n=1 Tax=Streptomyces sp. NPDC097619 TaxID=3157228 RepID=UPI00332A50F6
MSGVGVRPYAELTFDADADVDVRQRDVLLRMEATDLLVFSHGWNSDRSVATGLYDRFFAPFPQLAGPGVRLGYVGVLWPSMRFSDEPIPDFGARGLLPTGATGPGLDAETRAALGRFWPGREAELNRVTALLSGPEPGPGAYEELGALVRLLAGIPEPRRTGAGAGAGSDPDPDDPDAGAVAVAGAVGQAGAAGAAGAPVPALFGPDTAAACADLADALAGTAGDGTAPASPPAATAALPAAPPGSAAPELLGGLRKGGRELLRQATYYTMKKRAGVIGEQGLGPLLGRLARERPQVRVHLIGHSFGARLVSFSLRGLPAEARNVASLTLLQGAFSHYAFAESLPHDKGRGGALAGLQRRVSGPVVCCHSRHDAALGTFYPLASRLARDSASLLGSDPRWGAMGHGGIQAVPGTVRLTLDAALRGGLPGRGCVSVDAAGVVRDGGAPSGAHSDICHPELARVVAAAGRIGG